ncbi:hypothetical protein [Burkholderia cenocepacia]|uniref:hypothetical protein n=1 Tax=Burkholderia cenocepacia TaxID=95486 RepID=UPI000761AECC|nr:hypothetical protein [Burkholderia cenocepacia]KWU26341.1 hypothetical protein AS149_25465 [Burkholderia cenocepacia]
MQLDITKESLKGLSEKLVLRLNSLGAASHSGSPLVVDQGYEVIAAMLGFRNQHAMRVALKSGDRMSSTEPSALSDEDRARLVQFGYAVKQSDLHRPYWEWGDHASEDFDTDEQAWLAAWKHADEHGYLNVLPERAGWVAFVARLESQWVTEHPWYTRDQWRTDVGNHDTSSGYWEYVASGIESHGGEAAHNRAGEPLEYLADQLYEEFDFQAVFGDTVSAASRNGWEYTHGEGSAQCVVFLEDSTKPDEPTRKVRFIVSLLNGQAEARVAD